MSFALIDLNFRFFGEKAFRIGVLIFVGLVSIGASAAAYLLPKTPKGAAASAWLRLFYYSITRSRNLRYMLLCAGVLSFAVKRLFAGQAGIDSLQVKTSFAVSFLIVWYSYYKLFVVEHGRAKFQRNYFNVQVVERAGLLQELFRPIPWAFNSTGQTVTSLAFSQISDRLWSKQIVYVREVIKNCSYDGNSQFLEWAKFETEADEKLSAEEYRDFRKTVERAWNNDINSTEKKDGDYIHLLPNRTGNNFTHVADDHDTDGKDEDALEHVDEDEEEAACPILILIHGFGNDKNFSPLLRFAKRARELGWRAVTWSYWRFDFGETRDLRAVITHIAARNKNSPLIAVGWSAGGHLLFRYLEDYGNDTLLTGAVALSPVQDMLGTRKTMSKLYQFYVNVLAKISARRHLKSDCTLSISEREKLSELIHKSTDAFDLYDRFLFSLPGGYSRKSTEKQRSDNKNSETYSPTGSTFSHYRPTNLDIRKVKIPTLVIHADDDPMAVSFVNDWAEMVRQNKHLIVVNTNRGGHCAYYDGVFLPGGSTWDLRVAVRFISALLETTAQSRHVEIIIERKLFQLQIDSSKKSNGGNDKRLRISATFSRSANNLNQYLQSPASSAVSF